MKPKKFNRFLFFSCPHFTMTPPQNRQDNYGDLILQKIKFILDSADDLQANPVCLGDWFHKKTGVTNKEIYQLIKTLENYNIMTVLGNHDIQAYNPNLETQPLGIVELTHVIDMTGDWKFYASDERFIHVTAENYHADYDVPETFERKGDKNAAYHIHLTHGLLTNQKLPYSCVDYRDIKLSADLLVNGHFHEPWESVEDGIVNTGSVARIAMTENGMNKTPMCYFAEINKPFGKGENVFEWLQIPVEEDVWIKRTTRETMSNEEADKFIDKLREAGRLKNDQSMLQELIEEVEEDVRDDVEKKVRELLEEQNY